MGRLIPLLLLLVGGVLVPPRAYACACGCGVFDVQMSGSVPDRDLQTASALPTPSGSSAFLEYDYTNQDQNWSQGRKAPAEKNGDLRIRTNFVTAGARAMRADGWGLMTEVPLWQRYFQTTDDSGDIVDSKHSFLGDVRLRGVYAGFSPDMSSGLTFGAKLPTGNYKNPDFDRDTQVGTGSTDLLLGAYHVGVVPSAARWRWFADGQLDEPVLIAAGYRPGAELDALAGAAYYGWRPGGVRVTPLAQVIGSVRWRDSGTAAHWGDTGTRRLVLSPGLELAAGGVRVNADVGFPVAQYVNGNQLVASRLFRVRMGYDF